MEKDIVDGKIGEVGTYDLELRDGSICFEVKAGTGPVSTKVEVALDFALLIDFLDAKIKLPGDFDKAIFGILKAAVLGK